MRLAITNTSSTRAVTALTFTDEINAFISGVTPTYTPFNFCGSGSIVQVNNSTGALTFSGLNLPAEGNCSFDVELTIPSGTPAGSYLNVTTPFSALVGDDLVYGLPGSDSLSVSGVPRLSKSFVDDPVDPGGEVQLVYTIENQIEGGTLVSEMGFTDVLTTVLSGLTAVDLPQTNICGTGSSLSGTTELTFTGGQLAAGSSCSFTVTLQVPASALPGSYPSTSTALTGEIASLAVTGGTASDNLVVGGLRFDKYFSPELVIPGETFTMAYTIENESSTATITEFAFFDIITNLYPGVDISGVAESDICGAGSGLTALTSTMLQFSGGTLGPETSCTFSVTLTLPANTAVGVYANSTITPTFKFDEQSGTVPGASGAFTVQEQWIQLDKQFIDDPVSPGSSIIVSYTMTNLYPNRTLGAVTFTDDYDGIISGASVTGLPQMNVCGAGSELSGSGVLTLSGGSLGGGASCTFSTTLQIPNDAQVGSYPSQTSTLAGTISGLDVSGESALDTLTVEYFAFEKAFTAASFPGGQIGLVFTIENLDEEHEKEALSFVDQLDEMLPGATAVNLPLEDACGDGSLVAGSDTISLTRGSLPGGGSCTFTVYVSIPSDTAMGSYLNITGPLQKSGLTVAPPALATLKVDRFMGFLPYLEKSAD